MHKIATLESDHNVVVSKVLCHSRQPLQQQQKQQQLLSPAWWFACLVMLHCYPTIGRTGDNLTWSGFDCSLLLLLSAAFLMVINVVVVVVKLLSG